MKITYLGHASFLLETAAGTRIVTDPYAQDIHLSGSYECISISKSFSLI